MVDGARCPEHGDAAAQEERELQSALPARNKFRAPRSAPRRAPKCSGIALRADQVFRHRLAARPGVELFVNMLEVGLDGRDRNLERVGDFF